MGITEFSTYYHKPCKFKMKGGKEVYGVIWEDRSNGRSEHYFASPGEYKAYREAKQLNDIAACEKLKLKVDIEEVVDAECLDV